MNTGRREFLKVVALGTGGLLLGFRLDALGAELLVEPPQPDAWVRIEPDDRIVITVGKSEMGQGVRSTLPQILADELDADPARVSLEQAEPGPRYTDLGTGGSSSTMDSWDPLRLAGAAAREMLVAAAAARWGVPAARCRTERGRVLDDTGRSLGYGELAGEAARLPVPKEPRVRLPREARLVGRRHEKADGAGIVRGSAVYGLDVRLPGMRYAVIARPPVLGGSLKTFDAAPVRKVPGVRDCFSIPSGVAIVADTTAAAIAGRRALRAEWESGPHASFSSAAYRQRLAEATLAPGITTRREGRGREGLAAAATRLEALYEYPFLAHAAIEPVNSTAWVRGGKCEIWAATQTPNAVQIVAARTLGIERGDVSVHVQLLGGGFGRRLGWDFNVESVEVARRLDGPVQLVWTREDDLRDGYFQAASAHRLFAGLDARGKVVAWEHRKASTPHNARRRPTEEQLRDPQFLAQASWGVNDGPYAIADFESTYAPLETPVPIGPWRAVYSPGAVFARESFIDEIAERTGRDAFALRMEMLGAGNPDVPDVFEPALSSVDRRRMRAVLETAARQGGWGDAPPPGRARGIACNVFHTGTYVAYVVEVSLRRGAPAGELPFRVERVVGAVDCGVVIDPDGVEQQVESGVLWSLSNVIGQTTFENGRAREGNFDAFRIARWGETPEIETHLVPNDDVRPHGLGEPVVCPFAPAVATALARLTGKRLRRLPIGAADLG